MELPLLRADKDRMTQKEINLINEGQTILDSAEFCATQMQTILEKINRAEKSKYSLTKEEKLRKLKEQLMVLYAKSEKEIDNFNKYNIRREAFLKKKHGKTTNIL